MLTHYKIDVMRVSISCAPRRLRSDCMALSLCTLTVSSAIAIPTELCLQQPRYCRLYAQHGMPKTRKKRRKACGSPRK